MGETSKGDDRSTWAVGGGVILGLLVTAVISAVKRG